MISKNYFNLGLQTPFFDLTKKNLNYLVLGVPKKVFEGVKLNSQQKDYQFFKSIFLNVRILLLLDL